MVEALRADRELLNQRFALRQRAGARIDEQAFQEHLRTTVNELIRGVASVQPERVRAVVNSLFDVSLDLFAAGLLGPNPKHPHVRKAWLEVLPIATRLLARDPTRVAGCLSNAADHLAAHSSARPSEWIERMRRLSPHCDSVSLWLDAGKVVAWRAGLVQYRPAALQLLREMPWRFAARCLDAPEVITEADWYKWLDRLDTDRWLSLVFDRDCSDQPVGSASRRSEESVGPASRRSLRIVRVTGGFRGFGGPCLRPPTVAANNGNVLVTDGGETWQLLADAFGTLWHRVSISPAKSRTSAARSKIVIDSGGRVAWDGMNQDFAELAGANSFACDGQTLAVTLPTSHHVFLIARATTGSECHAVG
jgi:hypothetical protein